MYFNLYQYGASNLYNILGLADFLMVEGPVLWGFQIPDEN